MVLNQPVTIDEVVIDEVTALLRAYQRGDITYQEFVGETAYRAQIELACNADLATVHADVARLRQLMEVPQ